MGLLDGQRARHEAAKEIRAEVAAVAVANCHDPLTHYATEVNKGSINMLMLSGRLNHQYGTGYRLAHIFEQGGNTLLVFEHSHP